VSDSSYTATRPAAVSANLVRLRNEAGWTREDLARASNMKKSSIEKFEVGYEPPTNHPYLVPITAALSKKLGRNVKKELLRGGVPVDFTKQQLVRVYLTQPNLKPANFDRSLRKNQPRPTVDTQADTRQRYVANEADVDTPYADGNDSTTTGSGFLFRLVNEFNQARLGGVKSISIDTIEPVLTDLVRQAGIQGNVLVSEEISKLRR
jgi:transcriptional regulator with XRE-family HTH domain